MPLSLQPPPSQQNQDQQENYIEQWITTWRDFCRALRSTREPFDSWVWTWRLTKSGFIYLFGASKLSVLCSLRIWRPTIPLVALFLIELCISSYFISLRQCIVLDRWCDTEIERGWCFWDFLHTSFVIYLAIMITLKFVQTCFTSPGVALPNKDNKNDEVNASSIRWRASEGRGGIACCNPAFSPEEEKKLVSLYGEQKQNAVENHCVDLSPSTRFTYCSKCQIWRPPRCHHCSACNRCILQMDHHCPWVNNCIGYNNLRLFFTTLTFLLVACYYAIFMTIVPVYELVKEDLKHGISMNYFGLNLYQELYSIFLKAGDYSRRHKDEEVPKSVLWIKVVFVIVVTAGCAISFLWSYHCRLLCTALTTIDHKATLTQKRNQLLQKLRGNAPITKYDNSRSSVNPFSQKSWPKNVHQVLGPNLWYNLIPSIRQQKILPPYLPKDDF